jgi:hypothetical protein
MCRNATFGVFSAVSAAVHDFRAIARSIPVSKILPQVAESFADRAPVITKKGAVSAGMFCKCDRFFRSNRT